MQIEKEVLKDLLFGLLTAVNAAEDGAVFRGRTLDDVLTDAASQHPEPAVAYWLVDQLDQFAAEVMP